MNARLFSKHVLQTLKFENKFSRGRLHAAACHDYFSGNPVCVVGCEEYCYLCSVFWMLGAHQWRLGDEIIHKPAPGLAHTCYQVLSSFSICITRIERVYPDFPRRKLLRQHT